VSKVRLYGNTSGYVDLQAPDVAGDVTITLPNATGPFALESYVDSAVAAGRGLVAVKNALFTGTQSASVAAGGNVAVTNLSITHTLADVSNKLIISAYFGATASSVGQGNVGIAVANDGTFIAVGNTDGSRISVGAGGRFAASSTEIVAMPSVTFVYSPGDISSHTYTVRAVNITGSTYTLYVNRSESDTNNQFFGRASSALVIQEVAV
jgi:hypothetical protein